MIYDIKDINDALFFSRLDETDKVIQVIAVPKKNVSENENYPDTEQKGKEFIQSELGLPGDWIQTSYTGDFRKNYGLPNYQYDKSLDAFIPPQPYPSWLYDEEKFTWVPPIEKPNNEDIFIWNEEFKTWEEDYEVE